MSALPLEHRVSALESEVRLLRGQMQSLTARSSNANWLSDISGSMKDFPEWDEVMEVCRELREAELAEFDKASEGGASCSSSTPAS